MYSTVELSKYRYSLDAMVLVLCLPNYPANSPFFYPPEKSSIGLIRNPGSAPHIPIVPYLLGSCSPRDIVARESNSYRREI